MASTDMLNGTSEFWAAALELIDQPRSLSESLGAMAGLISECFDADLCAIFLLEPRSDKLLLEACVGQGVVKGGASAGRSGYFRFGRFSQQDHTGRSYGDGSACGFPCR